MNTRCEISKNIVSSNQEDKPLIFISEEAINLKRDNDRLKQEVERLNNIFKALKKEMEKCNRIAIDDYVSIIAHEQEMLKILDKVGADKE